MAATTKLSRRLLIGGGAAAAVAGIYGYRVWSDPVAESAISVQRALELAAAGDIVLIDIRRPDEWQVTGVPQYGVPIDMRRTDFATAVQEAAGGKPVALICARGVRSRRTTYRLAEAGMRNVIDVPEGMLGSAAGPGWLRSGLPTVAYSS